LTVCPTLLTADAMPLPMPDKAEVTMLAREPSILPIPEKATANALPRPSATTFPTSMTSENAALAAGGISENPPLILPTVAPSAPPRDDASCVTAGITGDRADLNLVPRPWNGVLMVEPILRNIVPAEDAKLDTCPSTAVMSRPAALTAGDRNSPAFCPTTDKGAMMDAAAAEVCEERVENAEETAEAAREAMADTWEETDSAMDTVDRSARPTPSATVEDIDEIFCPVDWNRARAWYETFPKAEITGPANVERTAPILPTAEDTDETTG